MKSESLVDLEHPGAKYIKQTAIATTSATVPSAQGAASILNNAQNVSITGGSFSATTNTTTNFNIEGGASIPDASFTASWPSCRTLACNLGVSPLDALHKRAAPNAILNAGGRADDVRCHPGTRKEVLCRIETWRAAQDGETPPVFWLSGPAGAGKTAIVQTTAEYCNAQSIPQANFFFFRTDSTRNSVSPLVATLVHQTILLYPAVRDPVATVLTTNPLILDAILEEQLTQLIIIPLQTIQQSPSYVQPLILIDGLDECSDRRSQRAIIQAFDRVMSKCNPCPFSLLIASRDESHIQASFNNMSSQLRALYLDERYSPEKDIRAFVIDELKRVRNTHPLARMLDAVWPSKQDVEGIVKKSSGQFIYAATVVRFVKDSSASPALSLERVRGAARLPTNSKSPFAYLDAIYTYILLQVDDQDVLKDILHAQLLLQRLNRSYFGGGCGPVELLNLYNPTYTPAIIESCLADLTPLVQYKTYNTLLFHHASFPDYLLDQSRSGNYFVDVDSFNFKIQPFLWESCDQVSLKKFPALAYSGFLELRHLPPDFLDILIAPAVMGFLSRCDFETTVGILTHLYFLCRRDDENVSKYKQVIHSWISYNGEGFVRYQLQNRRQISPSQWPPCSHWYLAMAVIDLDIYSNVPIWAYEALLPETDPHTHETALWLTDLLHRIYRNRARYSYNYDTILYKWISWAAWNNIPLGWVGDIPNAWYYFQWCRIKKWSATYLGLECNTAYY